jgi:ABC-type transport system involved in cytochrome c biogenesis permease subunit
MRPRFSFSVTVLALTAAIVVGTAVFGFLAPAVPAQRLAASHALASVIFQLLAFFVVSAGAGILGWVAVYCLKRDGWHRLEWVAFLPLNYGGTSPFDTSGWASPK